MNAKNGGGLKAINQLSNRFGNRLGIAMASIWQWRRTVRQRFGWLALLGTIACLLTIALPTIATPSPSPSPLSSSPSLLEAGTILYNEGKFEPALTSWRQAEVEYARTGDSLNVTRSQINQAQAQKAMGFYVEAVKLLEDLNKRVSDATPTLEKVQILRSLGEAYLATGKLNDALKILDAVQKLATAENIGSETSGIFLALGLVNRAEAGRFSASELRLTRGRESTQAFTSLAGYRSFLETALSNFDQAILAASDPIDKVRAELNQIRLLVEHLPRLNQFLLDAAVVLPPERLTNLPEDLLQPLFNDPTLKRQSNSKTVKALGDDLAIMSGLPALKQQTARWVELLLSQTQRALVDLKALPPSRTAIDMRINLAQSLVLVERTANSGLELERTLGIVRSDLKKYQAKNRNSLTPTATRSTPKPGQKPKTPEPTFLTRKVQTQLQALERSSHQQAAQLLKQAIADAQAIQNQRSEAQAVAALTELYGRWAKTPQQWADVETLANRSLVLAQQANAPEITSRVQGLLGFALKNQGRVKEARAAFLVAARNLQSLRADLVAVDSDVQYNFRDSVEVIYREAVEALLPAPGEAPDQTNLKEARRFIESLQLAELDNFLRQACVEGRPVALDRVIDQENPKTAVIYPIILNNDRQIRVIVKIPGQVDLLYYPIDLPKGQSVEERLKTWQFSVRDPNEPKESRQLASQVYDWLVKPFWGPLQQSGVDTLVFVPDKTLRNVPMAALYDADRKKYLIQEYAVAISPGLQLYDPKPLVSETLNVLTAGKADFSGTSVSPVRGITRGEFDPLPYVKDELQLIQKRVPTQVLFEKDFTQDALRQSILANSFNVVHLATHGVFGYRKEETFIVADDGSIDVDQLSEILRGRNQTGGQSIEMLVLSACQTAEGDNRVTLGLAGIAVRAGARSTVGSLWSISDASTSKFMDRFYEELANAKATGATKAKALQMAQRSLLEDSSTLTSAPFFWAPYVLVGNWL